MTHPSSPRRRRTRRTQRTPLKRTELRLLEGATLATIVGVIAGVFFVTSIQRVLLGHNQFASVVSSVLVDLTNTDRSTNGLSSLTINQKLVAAAQAKADDMAARGYFAHTSPDGKDSWYWFRVAGYDYQSAGENLAVDFSDSVDVESAWMNSPSHRDNLLNAKYTEIGIATASGYYEGRPTTFVVQMFGTPRKTQPVAVVTQTRAVPQRASEKPTVEASGASVAGAQSDATESKSVPPTTMAETTAPSTPESAVAPAAQSVINWRVLSTSPSSTMRYAYLFLAVLVLLALALDTGLEIRWHHRRKAAAAGFLLASMCALFVVGDHLMFSDPILPQGATMTASAADAL